MARISKNRYWACVVYPESAPPDWIEQIKLQGLRAAISPLHDKDLNADEAEKKPHWHVILCWDGPTTANVAKAVTDKLCAPAPQGLASVKGYYRYLTHQDNPEKHQYDANEIQHIGGFDPLDFFEATRSETEAAKRQVMQIIRDADLLEYADLLELLADSDALELLSVAMNNTVLFRGYLQSRKGRIMRPQENSDS